MTTAAQERLVEVEAVEVSAADRAPIAAEKTFRVYDPEQVLLMAPSLREWVPDGDLAHFVSDLVESGALDLSAIYASYEEERGFPPYDPRLMVKLLVYGYANGVVSSRKLERATYRDVAVRMLCADQHPDHRSIARFRKRHLHALGELFVHTLRLCKQGGLVGLGVLAVDGTKLRANASRRKAMSYERMGKKEAQLEGEIAALREQVDAMLADAEATDQAEDEAFGADRRGDELPDELQRRETRLAVIREAKAALEAEAAATETARRAELAEQGKKPRQPPGGRDPFKPKPTAQRNFTDPESKIMKTADGAFHQCYNGQAIVDSTRQVIVVCELSDQAPDARLLDDSLDQLDGTLDAIGAQLSPGFANGTCTRWGSCSCTRDRPLQALRAARPGAARTGPQGRHAQAVDGPQAQEEARRHALRPPQDDRRTRLRTAADRPRRPPATDPRPRPRPRPMALSLRDPQPAQAAPQRRPGPHPDRMRATKASRGRQRRPPRRPKASPEQTHPLHDLDNANAAPRPSTGVTDGVTDPRS